MKDYGKYTSIAFQMIAVILLGVYGGIKLDEKFPQTKPLFTIVLIILAVFLSIYSVIKNLLNNK